MPEVILPYPACSSLSVGLCSGTDEITHELYNQAFCTSCGVSGPKVFADEISAIAAWKALPRALRWTHEPPKVAGWYWWRTSKGQNVNTIQVWSRSGVLGYCFDTEFITALDRGEWAGPIPPPID